MNLIYCHDCGKTAEDQEDPYCNCKPINEEIDMLIQLDQQPRQRLICNTYFPIYASLSYVAGEWTVSRSVCNQLSDEPGRAFKSIRSAVIYLVYGGDFEHLTFADALRNLAKTDIDAVRFVSRALSRYPKFNKNGEQLCNQGEDHIFHNGLCLLCTCPESDEYLDASLIEQDARHEIRQSAWDPAS